MELPQEARLTELYRQEVTEIVVGKLEHRVCRRQEHPWRRYQRSYRPLILATVAAGLLFAQRALAAKLHDVRTHRAEEGPSEVAFVLTGWVNAPDVDVLARCLPTKERRLPQTGRAAAAFRGIRWTEAALGALERCNSKDCRFNLPRWAAAKVDAAKGREAKKRAYYGLVRQLAWGVDKKRKRERITHAQVNSEICANHDLFHWLIDGKPRRWDRVVWRKHFSSSKRMRPTLEVLQISAWNKHSHRCIGMTVLFSDHYLMDAVEILQLTPLGNGRVAFRQYTRNRLDFFRSWWARRFRGRIRKSIRKRKLALLRDRMARCGAN